LAGPAGGGGSAEPAGGGVLGRLAGVGSLPVLGVFSVVGDSRYDFRAMRVCVIGAGFAGLVAARWLAERGVEPVVLEARSRVGGRVLSQQLANDAVAERGAEFAEAGHRTVATVAGRLGLRLVPVGLCSGEREPRGGIGATRRSVRDQVARLQELVADGRVELAGRSAAEVLAELVPDAGVRQAIGARLQVTWARPVEELAASVLERVEATFSPSESLRGTGGNQRIALRLAERLGPRLRLGSAADLVEWSSSGVRVRAAGGWVEADRCVVTVPAGVLDSIRFAPALPETTPGRAAPTPPAPGGGGRRTRSCWPARSPACTSPGSTPPASGPA
jgi:monoamine oxidase